jgi:hypothetical protein
VQSINAAIGNILITGAQGAAVTTEDETIIISAGASVSPVIIITQPYAILLTAPRYLFIYPQNAEQTVYLPDDPPAGTIFTIKHAGDYPYWNYWYVNVRHPQTQDLIAQLNVGNVTTVIYTGVSWQSV